MPASELSATNPAAVDLNEAQWFLGALCPGEPATFQVFDDNPQRDHKNKRLSMILHGTLVEPQDALVRANEQNAGVFVAINRTDGRGRSKKNVTSVRAVMADLDGAPLDPVLACPLKPHIIVETSGGYFQALWRVDDLPLE